MIYGQARKASVQFTGGEFLELHYYHLWGRDCGRMGHRLDAEHVSVLLRSERLDLNPESWTATHWYAAAHQDTICDSSSAARAVELAAEHNGPVVWISRGKHASFLSYEDCRSGCGGDRCEKMVEAPNPGVINLGEINFPMNGAVWISSRSWPLSQKFTADFSPQLVARIDAAKPGDVIEVSDVPSSVHAILLGGNASADGLAVGNEHTSSALSVAAKKTWKSLRISAGAVKKVVAPEPSEPAPPKTN